jgi:hypothetical protein
MVAGHYVHVAVEGHGSSSLLFVVKVMVWAVLSLSKLLLYFCFLVSLFYQIWNGITFTEKEHGWVSFSPLFHDVLQGLK